MKTECEDSENALSRDEQSPVVEGRRELRLRSAGTLGAQSTMVATFPSILKPRSQSLLSSRSNMIQLRLSLSPIDTGLWLHSLPRSSAHPHQFRVDGMEDGTSIETMHAHDIFN